MKIPATDPPEPLDYDERRTLRGYGHLARHLYPGAVGELVQRECVAWAEFGYRTHLDGLMARVVADLDTEARRRSESRPERRNGRPSDGDPPEPPTGVRDALRAAWDAVAKTATP